MVHDVDESTFQAEVVDRSYERPVLVDFWAPWCGPCRTLGPVLERAVEGHGGAVELAKVNVDDDPGLGARFGVQGIPAVKAFRDGRVADEFAGARPAAFVEAFVGRLLPTEADTLVAAGDELSLRRAVELEPRRADARVALGRALLRRGRGDEARGVLRPVEFDHDAAGLIARVELAADLEAPNDVVTALAALDEGDHERALQALLEVVGASQGETRERVRRLMVGLFGELGHEHPLAIAYRRRLAAALF